MSSEAFKEFASQLAANEDLQEALRSRADSAGRVSMAEVADLAAERGYRFSAEDISSELSEEQLDAVAGGTDAVIPKLEINLSSSTSTTTQSLKMEWYQSSLFLKFY